MRNVPWPEAAKIGAWRINVQAHSRGGAGAGGHYSFERGPGAHFLGQVEVVPMRIEDALTFRAFLHALRGKSGTFLLQVPVLQDEEEALADGTVGFTDDTTFDDNLGFSDSWDGVVLDTATGSLDAAAAEGATTLTLTEGLFSTQYMTAGAYLVVGDIEDDGQLLVVTAIDGQEVTIRPRLRAAQAFGTVVTVGAVVGKFRLDKMTPSVPIIASHSLSLRVEIAEAY